MKNHPLTALFLNCTLKYSPEISNTEALMDKLINRMREIHNDLEIAKLSWDDLKVMTTSLLQYKAALDKPELNALFEIRRKNLGLSNESL